MNAHPASRMHPPSILLLCICLFLFHCPGNADAQCITTGGCNSAPVKPLYNINAKWSLPGRNGGPSILWPGPGQNDQATSGPVVHGSVNGGGSPVFLGNGAAYLAQIDFYLPLNGIDWFHRRLYSNRSSSSLAWQGEGWWCNEMMHLSVAGAEGASDVAIEMDPHRTLHFTYSGGAWTCDDAFLYTLAFSAGDDEYLLTAKGGRKYVFHDSEDSNAGKLKRIEDPYGNDWVFTYASGRLTEVVIHVVEGTNHKITYTYYTSGDNAGQLEYLKLYKSTTPTSADLIGQVEYTYFGASESYGSEDDLKTVTIRRKATSDGDGILSIEEKYYYRYYKGTYDSQTNPGTDHQVRYVLHPENAQRLNEDKGDPTAQSNSDFADYADILYEYDSNGRVRKTRERLPSRGGSGTAAGGTPLTTDYTWTVNSGSPALDEWKIHCLVDRDDDTRVIFDVNRLYQILTWVVQDENDGSPTRELIWHFDYGTSGPTENRLTTIHLPSNCTAYAESAPYGVTVSSAEGVVYAIDYDYATSTYDGYPEKVQIKKGTGGTADTLFSYGRTIPERPCLATTLTEYESSGEEDGRTISISYGFYDAGGAKVRLKEIDVTYPAVSTAKNGPGTGAVEKFYYDKRTGALRWILNGEGFVDFYAYDAETGVLDLVVKDVNTSTLPSVVDDRWDGVSHGGLRSDDSVPFPRTGGGTALNIDASKTIDWLGRVRKDVDEGGMITYFVYKDDETRTYPAWDSTDKKTLLPIRVEKTDKEGRPEDLVLLKNTLTPSTANDEPSGSETYTNSDMASRTIHVYDIAGRLLHSDRYHALPTSGTGSRYTHYYRTSFEYDAMGRLAYTLEDVSDETPYDREQVTKYSYDFMGRDIKIEEGVSDNTHDLSSGKPTLNTVIEYFYDDPNDDAVQENGEGDGNLSWVRKYYGTAAGEHNDTRYRYDDRDRRCITQASLAPHTLVAYDNLDRIVSEGTYSTTANLSPGDDPATTDATHRLGLTKTYYDEVGRVYKTETFDDPADAVPADALATNRYYDRRNLVWAEDAPNTGITFTEYDGAGRRIKVFRGTQFDTSKYTSNAPDYPDGNEGIVELTEYTLDDAGMITKEITKELNHDDTNGMDPDGTDFIRTYVYHWYDAAHRRIASADYGTYNSTGWKDNPYYPARTTEPPSLSDTVLVTSYGYDSGGRQNEITDPKGIKTRYTFDALGRTVSRIEDYGTGSALNRTVEFAYNGQGNRVQIILDPDGDNLFSSPLWTLDQGTDTDQETKYEYKDSQNAGRMTKEIYPDGGAVAYTYHVDGTVANRTDPNGTVFAYAYDALRRKTQEKVTTLGTYTGGAGQVDGTIRALTWKYDDEGRVTYVTSHTDDTPDMDTWTDAANQVAYTYNAADRVMKEAQEVDGAVDASSPAVEYGYGTDYSTGNYNRLNYMEYPNGRKIWYGYTHTGGASTFQDTINDVFSRPGQIGRDGSGAMGDLLAEYDFNGLGRLVRRVHDEGTGAYGNDTRMDLWHGTSGTYAGLDRFGRIVDMKFTAYAGTPTDFARRKYTYDRNGNRTSIEHVRYASDSQSFTYDALNRLTEAKRGFLNTSHQVYASGVKEGLNMDIAGNYTPAAGGIKINSTSASITHAVNAANEITTLDRPNPAGMPKVVAEDFTTLSAFWSQDAGTWSTTSGEVNVDSLTSGEARLLINADLDMDSYVVKVKFPTGSATAKAGLLLAYDPDGDDGYAVVLDRGAGKLALYPVSGGTFGSALATDDVTIGDDTYYTVHVTRRQRNLTASVDGQSTYFSYSSTEDFGTGESGLYAEKTNVKFDCFYAYDMTVRDPKFPRIAGAANASIASGALLVEDTPYRAEVAVENFLDDDYLVQVDLDLTTGTYGEVWVRRVDPNNGYLLRLDSSDSSAGLYLLENGALTLLGTSNTYPGSSPTVKIKVNGTSIKVWFDGSLQIDVTDSFISAGGVAFSGEHATFDNLKIGYDRNSDDDIDDPGDDVVLDEDFRSTQVSFTYDDAGNLVDDGTFTYMYDAWNRLVKVRASEDADVTLQESEYDGLGRRIEKVVTNAGEYDGTVVYIYDGHRIMETRDGAGATTRQFVHGLRYIDELVMMRVKNKGDLYVHQDANWNVIALTDLGGHVVERYVYRPYGEMIVHQETSFGDYDGDYDVDTTDRDAYSGSAPVGAERILDLDFDGDVDATDKTLFNDNLVTGIARHPGRWSSGVEQPFGHQGLVFDPEIGSYQNRYRQLDPVDRRFMQRDPAGYVDGMNLYEYCKSNSLIAIDPYGKSQNKPIVLKLRCPSKKKFITNMSCDGTGPTEAIALYNCQKNLEDKATKNIECLPDCHKKPFYRGMDFTKPYNKLMYCNCYWPTVIWYCHCDAGARIYRLICEKPDKMTENY